MERNKEIRKLPIFNFRNLKNSLTKGNDCNKSQEECSNSSDRNRTLNIFRSIKKKCKGTLSTCKPKAKHCSEVAPIPETPTMHFPELRQCNNECNSSRSVQQELSQLSHFGWYWGTATRTKAEERLKDEPDGAFLLRDSSSDNYILTLSFRSSGRTFHSRIEHSCGSYTFYSQQQGFASIQELIETSMGLSRSNILCYSSQRRDDVHPRYPVRLVKPVSRFIEMRGLQYLCRFVIRQYITLDNIPKLPLPNTLQAYLEEDYW